VTTERPADTAAFGGGYRAGVGGTLQGVGAFHLGEQRQQHHSELCHRIIRVGGIDADRIAKVTHADAAFAQVVNQVENLAHGPAELVKGVDDDHVAVASIAQQGFQPGPVNRRPGLLVGVDVNGLDADAGESIDLPVEVLLGGRRASGRAPRRSCATAKPG
jgi:hypothetical protein